MNTLPYLLYSATQTRELDRLAIEKYNISANILMERAGDAAFALLLKHWPQAKRLAVFCGTGNNGGDAYVLARLAREKGLDVDVYQIGDSSKLKGDALSAMQRSLGVDITPIPYTDQVIANYDVLVDGLLGTGISGEVNHEYHQVIETINKTSIPILALDIPSGLNADTGGVCGVAIKAEHTISFIGLKSGLFTGAAPEYTGELHFASLNVPAIVYEELTPVAKRLDYAQLKSSLTLRRRDAHKGDFGHLLIIGGNTGMCGAVRLAAEAGLRAGAGLVSVATRERHSVNINSQRPEIMSHGVEHGEQLQTLLEKATVVVIGPGLGQDNWAEEMMSEVLVTDKPLLLDADALNIIATQLQFDSLIRAKNRIFTPHPGEAARLLEQTGQQIQNDRFNAVRALEEEFNGTWVLKGAGTLVASKKEMGICHAGNPGMATGGMGDVLTGIIGGLMAQQYDNVLAAQLGVCIHAEAADAAVKAVGERGLLAKDLMPGIRRLVNPNMMV
ncbi:MAG: NAD(P)H-hydrate dehydratase [Gammaproteobacteria bacterium]|nr:NAD(P)H-hydrate dehydratase [Gammaproteobacteria bacterium]